MSHFAETGKKHEGKAAFADEAENDNGDDAGLANGAARGRPAGSPRMNAAERLEWANRVRERIRLAFPDEFGDGARRGFTGDRQYPPGFTTWPLARRNAWFCGWGVGYYDPARPKSHGNG